MSAFTVAATITALDGADWLPPTLNWEIATTDGVWGAHCEIAAADVSEAYRLLCSIASARGAEVGDDDRLLTVDFTYDDVPVRAWWLRPVTRWDVPEQCATCPTVLSGPAVSFVRLGVGSDAPVICVPCRDRMHGRWVKGDAARDAEVLREAADKVERIADTVEARVAAHYGAASGIGPGSADMVREVAGSLRDWADEAGKVTPTGGEITQPAELTIYRASHESIVMGLYTTTAAARAHCESDMRRDLPSVSLDWIEDEEDGVAELVAAVGEEERPTGFVVTALEVASAYDEEADE
ncbi:hypothetical protein AB0H03_06525 [Streptomyces sparsogenes]|uniref:hypothetical protein n=1 Tax=Streptomyces sparsogenes TaxID=67365 RepID=UPI0033D36EF5